MEENLEQVIGKAINTWHGGRVINVEETLDALVNVIAAISVKAGCITKQRRRILADHMKNNLASALEAETVRHSVQSN